MSETNILPPVYIHTFKVDGDILQACGEVTDPQLFPRQPFALELDYSDFENSEDFQTVARILTATARRVVKQKIDAKEIKLR